MGQKEWTSRYWIQKRIQRLHIICLFMGNKNRKEPPYNAIAHGRGYVSKRKRRRHVCTLEIKNAVL